MRIRTVIGVKKGRTNYVKNKEFFIQPISGLGPLVDLPRTYCKEMLPVDPNEIITMDALKSIVT